MPSLAADSGLLEAAPRHLCSSRVAPLPTGGTAPSPAGPLRPAGALRYLAHSTTSTAWLGLPNGITSGDEDVGGLVGEPF
jgi:hypothetical protein